MTEHVTDADARAAVADAAEGGPVGRFLDQCGIDLPPNDVVERIEFEKFFKLNLTYGDMREAPPRYELDPEGTHMQPVLVDARATRNPHLYMRLEAGEAESERGDEEDEDAVEVAVDVADLAIDADVRDLPMALYMPFVQEWKLRGYTRGRIVNSFSLIPGEQQTVDVFTWAKSSSTFTSTSSFEIEQINESSGTRHDASDVARDMSHQAGLQMTTDGKVGFSVGVVNVNLGAGMAASANMVEAEKDTRQTIVEATTRSTGRVRTSRTLTVTESQESGREERVTRTLQNKNECHTLTIPFYEVLANYEVSTAVQTDDVQLVALVGSASLDKVPFDRHMVRLHETSLRLALLDRSLIDGFDAARFLDARDRACGVLCNSCTCGEDDMGDTDSTEWTTLVTAARTLGKAATAVRGKFTRYPLSVRQVVPPPVGFGFTPGIMNDAKKDIKSYLFKKTLAANAPTLAVDLASVGIIDDTSQVSVSQVRSLANVIAALPPQVYAALRFDPKVSDGAGWELYPIVLSFLPEFFSAGGLTQWIKDFVGMSSYEDEGLVTAISSFNSAYSAWSTKMAAEAEKDEAQKEIARIAREERNIRILEAFGLKETANAEERFEALLDHLNEQRNFDHYRFAVWNERAGDADPQITALAMAGILDPTPVGIVGDYLAVPIRLDAAPQWAGFFNESVADLVKQTETDVDFHILPTSALYSEAIVGDCCACEDDLEAAKKLELAAAGLRNDAVTLENVRLQARIDNQLFDKEFPPNVCVCCCGGDHHHHDHDHEHGHHHRDDDDEDDVTDATPGPQDSDPADSEDVPDPTD